MNTQSTTSQEIFKLPGFGVIREPLLLFDPVDGSRSHVHPLIGLLTYGPFSASQIGVVSNPIRVATISPSGEMSRLETLLRELEGRHSPRERRAYLPDYPGFSKIFKVAITHSPGAARISLASTLDQEIRRANIPHEVLAKAVVAAIQTLRNVRSEFDLVLLYLPERWHMAFEASGASGFDLHDYLKAHSASLGIPIQIVNDRPSGAISYYCRCSVAWRLAIALYCKAGGIPWTLSRTETDTAYIGISYALRTQDRSAPRFAICCSQVFDAEGAGLDFIAYEAEDVRVFGKNPFLSRIQMTKVMSRSLDIYQHRHSGRKPKRIVVHKNTEFKKGETEGCLDAFSFIEDVELIHIQQNVSWRGVYMPERLKPDGYPIPRGAYLILDGTEALLWTQGNGREFVGNSKSYYKEGKGIPEPLLIHRYAGQGDMAESCNSILRLSKMDWNNDGPYDRLPVTMNYASTLANVVKRLPHLDARPYPFRLFM